MARHPWIVCVPWATPIVRIATVECVFGHRPSVVSRPYGKMHGCSSAC